MPHRGRRSLVWPEATRYSESHLPPNARKMVTQSIAPHPPCMTNLTGGWFLSPHHGPMMTPSLHNYRLHQYQSLLSITPTPHWLSQTHDPYHWHISSRSYKRGWGEWGRGKRPVFAAAPNRYYPIFLHPHYWYDAIEYCYIMINLVALMANWVMIWMRKGRVLWGEGEGR